MGARSFDRGTENERCKTWLIGMVHVKSRSIVFGNEERMAA